MRIALTGAAGMIGGTVRRCLTADHEIATVGRRAGSDLTADFAQPDSVRRLDLNGIDALIHCAGIVDEDFVTDPETAFRQATLGTSMLVQRARECSVKRFILVSTSHVYGAQSGRIDEDRCPDPRSDYAIAHYAAEQVVRRSTMHDGAGKAGFRALILRPNAVFGIPTNQKTFDRWHLIPYDFPMAAVREQCIVLKSSGEQRRNFIGAEDLSGIIARFLSEYPRGDLSQMSVPEIEAGMSAGRTLERNAICPKCVREDNCLTINPVGETTISVCEFALRCAAVYEKLTGRACRVCRPEMPAGSLNSRADVQQHGATFDYLTKYPELLYGSRQSLDTYLENFIQLLIEQKQT